MTKLQGACFCGTIEFTLTDPTVLHNLACHCTNCRKFHGSDYAHYAVIPSDQYTITKGMDKVGKITTQPENCQRNFCKDCGSRVGCSLGGKAFIEISMLAGKIPKEFTELKYHIKYNQRIVDIQDDLPKYLNLPKEFGGTGETMSGSTA
jgi:hypothetical protein